mgnify:CR=1 FL=1
MADIALNAGVAVGCPSGLASTTSSAAAAATAEANARSDLGAFVRKAPTGLDTIELMVTGAKCAGCIAKIEQGLKQMPGVEEARLNLSTQRLRVGWRPRASLRN